jgi:hypothetical protein
MRNFIKFDEWMKDINNIYYANHERMSDAYQRLTAYEEVQCTKLHSLQE